MTNKINLAASFMLVVLVGLSLMITGFMAFQINDNTNLLEKISAEILEDEHSTTNDKAQFAETHESEHDFGTISKKDGKVSVTFEIENHGKGLLEIGTIATSCSCTSATIDKTKLEFDEIAILTVTMDPNFHEEPEGSFERVVYVETNDPNLPEMEFTISLEIID